MTSLTQLIQESAKTVDPEKKYYLRPGEANALVLTLCVNQNVVPDFEEAMDMIHRFESLSPAEQMALAKRIAEISRDSDKTIGFHHVGGPVVNLWVREKKTQQIEFNVIANECNGRMVAQVGDAVVLIDGENTPEPKPYFKEGDL